MIYHIIDHIGFGTIHKLLLPLNDKNTNHEVIDFDNYLKLENIASKMSETDIIVIHTTASKKSNFIYNFLKYFKDKKVYIFMHVSANYEVYKGRKDILIYLKYLNDNFGTIVLTPSKEVTEQYKKIGINARTIQLGVDFSKIDTNEKEELSPYYNKIITTCSSDNDIYKYVKGIDIYEEFINRNNLKKYALIAGTNEFGEINLPCRQFAENDFLNILSHSIMYVQFSRFESYNLTATFSKFLKIPVLLLNSEGNYSCMRGNVYEDIYELEADALKIMSGNVNYQLLENMHNDALTRESIINFKQELELLRREKNEFTKKRI